MFGFLKRAAHREISPAELHALLERGAALVIDVREPGEFAAGHIAGAVNVPLSGFSPDKLTLSGFTPGGLPEAGGRLTVLQCAAGRRSAQALDRCAKARSAIDTHLAGGIGAWKRAGLPLVAG